MWGTLWTEKLTQFLYQLNGMITLTDAAWWRLKTQVMIVDMHEVWLFPHQPLSHLVPC